MCVALPGRVLETDGSIAVVDFQGNRVRAEAGLVTVKPGDSVLVHAGCILQVLSEVQHCNLLFFCRKSGQYRQHRDCSFRGRRKAAYGAF